MSPQGTKRPRKSGYTTSLISCRTCKRRKVKCDERRPHCLRCERSTRTCEGYPASGFRFAAPETIETAHSYHAQRSVGRLTNDPEPVLVSVADSVAERRSFQYFLEKAPRLGSELHGWEFWGKFVPCIATESKPVRQALVALSALQERNDSYTQDGSAASQRSTSASNGLLWYTRAVTQCMEIAGASCNVGLDVLVTCVLFFMIEAQQWNVDQALKLFNTGIKMFRALTTETSSGDRRMMADFFTQHGDVALQRSATFEGLQAHHDLNPSNLPSQLMTSRICIPPQPLEQFRVELSALTTRLIRFTDKAKLNLQNPGQSIVLELQHLKQDLAGFHTRVSSWEPPPTPGRRAARSFAWCKVHLLAYNRAAFILASVSLDVTQISFDKHVEDFAMIIDYASTSLVYEAESAEQPTLTFELSLVRPLSITAIKCRDPILRTKALGLLRRLSASDRIRHKRALLLTQTHVESAEDGSGVGEPQARSQASRKLTHSTGATC